MAKKFWELARQMKLTNFFRYEFLRRSSGYGFVEIGF